MLSLKQGNMYCDGRGVEKNESKAVEWYLKAAEIGHGKAMHNLGLFYETGRGVEKDLFASQKVRH